MQVTDIGCGLTIIILVSKLALGLVTVSGLATGHQWFSGNIISVLTRVTHSHTVVTLVLLVIQWYEVWSVANGIYEEFFLSYKQLYY